MVLDGVVAASRQLAGNRGPLVAQLCLTSDDVRVLCTSGRSGHCLTTEVQRETGSADLLRGEGLVLFQGWIKLVEPPVHKAACADTSDRHEHLEPCS